jgi:hypothetical protein
MEPAALGRKASPALCAGFSFPIYFRIDFEKKSDQFLGLIVMSH